MPVHDNLGCRMKDFYETIPKTRLMRRTPVAIRIDGKAFHTFTKGFKRPFDDILIKTMQETTKYLCENIQGCVLGYTQSDEITLILTDYKTFTTEAWFNYEVQKICSIAASMATMAFNKFFSENIEIFFNEEFHRQGLGDKLNFETREEWEEVYENLEKKYEIYYNKQNLAMFDARCFNIPKEEVTNLIYWRQLDATRNSIQMVGQANFSHKELHGKTCNNIQDMLMEQKDINWNDFPAYQKRGSCVIKNKIVCEPWGNRMLSNEVPEGHWFIDKDTPIFKEQGREYIEKLITVGEE